MKKVKLLLVFLLSFLFVGCSIDGIETSIVNVFKQTYYSFGTKQEDKLGFEGIYSKEMLDKMENEDFFFYLYDGSMPNELMEEVLYWGIVEKNIDIQANKYVIDFNSLKDKEKESIRKYFETNGLYAIKDNIVLSLNNYPKMLSLTNINNKNEYKKVVESWFYSTMVGTNNHGFETITYEKVLEKIENKETFMLYIGRNSCKYCQIFTPVLKSLFEQYDFYIKINDEWESIPLYYLDTQSYYNDIIYEKENAQENWDKIKETFDINYTPAFLLYKDEFVYKDVSNIMNRSYTYGCKQFIKYIGEEYFLSTSIERNILFDNCLKDLKDDLNYHGKLEKKDLDYVDYFKDDCEYLFNNEESYNEDCFTYEENWKRYVENQEYIDIIDDEYLENLEDNFLNYSVSLRTIIAKTEDTYTLGNSGTGFIIDIKEDCMYIATNKHVIDEYGEFGFEVKFCSLWSQEHIPRYNDNFLGKYTYFWKPLKGKAFLVGYSEDLDFAILKFDFKDNNFKGEERYLFTSIPKFETNISNIGDIIYRWNTTSLSKKEINYVCDEYNIVDLDAECSLGEHFIKLNKSGIPGTSGSPYFNQNGQFVGIHVGSNQTHRVSFILPSYVLIEEYEKIIGEPLFYT